VKHLEQNEHLLQNVSGNLTNFGTSLCWFWAQRNRSQKYANQNCSKVTPHKLNKGLISNLYRTLKYLVHLLYELCILVQREVQTSDAKGHPSERVKGRR